jgi:hypothetical protein
MTSGTFNYIRFPGSPHVEPPLIPRPCFFCGEMMDIIKSIRQLICKQCDVTEACNPLIYLPKLAATAATWHGEEIPYVNHAEVHAPTP